MDYNSTKTYVNLVNNLSSYNVPDDMESSFNKYTLTVFRADQQEVYSKPTSGIGIYVAAASLLCVFAMAADLLHGLRNRKLWFPCNYFTINAAFLSVISVAMKLPMDMSSSMPGEVDQMTKLGSMAFLCTMMANLLPSLATMNSKELRTNLTGLGVMVITLLLNICIQIVTGVVTYREDARVAGTILPNEIKPEDLGVSNKDRNTNIAITYMALLLVLLIIHICSSLAILKFKKTIDGKYQVCHETASKEQQQSDRLPVVEKLREHVTKYWIMAGTGSLQFISVCSATTSAAGVICVLSTVIHIKTSILTIGAVKKGDYNSDYKWSVVIIFAIQSIGVILGTVAPFCRCFAPLCFKVSIESVKNHLKVFMVECYWTQKLHEWKRKSLIPSRSHKIKVIVEVFKIVFINVCIQFQEAVVVACKIISLVPFFIMMCAFYCLKCFKCRREAVVSSKKNEEPRVESGEKNEGPDDLRGYVLQLEDEKELSGTTLKWLSRSTQHLIEKGVRRQPKDLLELIKQSSDFKEVENFDSDHVTSLLSKEYPDCWSLPVVTLTTIAVSLGIDKSKADELLRSVKEGLEYVTHVEESLNSSNDYVSIRKAAETLWLELEVRREWFGRNFQEELASLDSREKIVEWFKNLSKSLVKEVESSDVGSQDDDKTLLYESICANSMYRITKTIKPSNNTNNNDNSRERELLFDELSKKISGILAACLTNLPQVIVMKCHNSEIEKREASVKAAARLLGETTEIINTLQKRELPRLDPHDLAFIDKWYAAFP